MENKISLNKMSSNWIKNKMKKLKENKIKHKKNRKKFKINSNKNLILWNFHMTALTLLSN